MKKHGFGKIVNAPEKKNDFRQENNLLNNVELPKLGILTSAADGAPKGSPGGEGARGACYTGAVKM